MVTYTVYTMVVALVGLERLVELRLSRRNAAVALSRGGIELGRGHFTLMALLHAAFLPSCVMEVWALHRPFVPSLFLVMLILELLAQGLRYWVIHTLGWRWNVRVIVVPGEPVVASGPYRFMRHPNYLAVVVEGLALPLMHGAYLTALGFTLLNAAILWKRIRTEERALRTHCDYEHRLGDRWRLVPRAGAHP